MMRFGMLMLLNQPMLESELNGCLEQWNGVETF